MQYSSQGSSDVIIDLNKEFLDFNLHPQRLIHCPNLVETGKGKWPNKLLLFGVF